MVHRQHPHRPWQDPIDQGVGEVTNPFDTFDDDLSYFWYQNCRKYSFIPPPFQNTDIYIYSLYCSFDGKGKKTYDRVDTRKFIWSKYFVCSPLQYYSITALDVFESKIRDKVKSKSKELMKNLIIYRSFSIV